LNNNFQAAWPEAANLRIGIDYVTLIHRSTVWAYCGENNMTADAGLDCPLDTM